MKKALSLLLALFCLVALFAACTKPEDPAEVPGTGNDGTQNTGGDGTTAPSFDASLPVRVWTLNGTTGFGMAPLIHNKAEGTAALNYTFTVETNATNVRDAIINGTADIAAVPTNVASALYNATSGGVKVLAINTAGVLYLVTNTTRGATATSLADLSGKTLYCPAQNPAFITKALLDASGVSGVTLDSTTYADPTDLRTAVASGLVDYAVLPEPMVTIARSAAAQQNITITVALDLTEEWNKYFTAGSLVQGCVVVRNSFLAEHPAEVAKFLEEYNASITYVNAEPESAAAMIATAGIFAQSAVAKQAIPKCNICYIAGAQMKTALSAFLAQMPLASVGGALPGDDFYYGA